MRDIDVRTAVLKYLNEVHLGDRDTRIVQEMGIWSGSVRIDIAVINGELSGFELKSDHDTLERLPQQAELYSYVFDRVVLVAGVKHLDKAIAKIPEWWGVKVARADKGCILISNVRQAQKNPSPNSYLVAQLLWREEALSILDEAGASKGIRSKPMKILHERLAAIFSNEELSHHVRSALKRRGSWLSG